MSDKELSPVPLQQQQLGNAPSPLAVEDVDPLRFRVIDPVHKTREFTNFIGDHHRYFAAAAAAAAASAATPHPHPEFRQNFYSDNPIHGSPRDSDEDDEEGDGIDSDDDSHVARRSNAANRDCSGEGSSARAVTVADPDNAVLYSQHFKTIETSYFSRHKDETAAENGCGFSGRKETSSSSNSMDSLRAILSDPITGALLDDAMILPCGHSFGARGIEQVKQMRACCTCSQPVSEDLITPNLTLRVTVQAFCREANLLLSRSSKGKGEGSDQYKLAFGNSTSTGHPRNKSNQFPFSVSDRVVIKGNKRTPPRFVGRVAVVTTQCLNGWYVVKTLDNAESVKLQYRSLAKAPEDLTAKVATTTSKMVSNWL